MTGLKIKLADINNNGNNTMPRGRYWASLGRGLRIVCVSGWMYVYVCECLCVSLSVSSNCIVSI